MIGRKRNIPHNSHNSHNSRLFTQLFLLCLLPLVSHSCGFFRIESQWNKVNDYNNTTQIYFNDLRINKILKKTNKTTTMISWMAKQICTKYGRYEDLE
jgi:hypothetical protein